LKEKEKLLIGEMQKGKATFGAEFHYPESGRYYLDRSPKRAARIPTTFPKD